MPRLSLLPLQVPAAWRAGDRATAPDADGFATASWASLSDPVLGSTCDVVALRVRPAPPGIASVADFGPQERIAPAAALGLAAALPELARADITRASKRTVAVKADAAAAESPDAAVEAPALFYEWELAVPPETCAYNTGCNSVAVYFVSATVRGGQLAILTLKQTEEAQYRANAGAIRAARATFAVAEAAAASAAAADDAGLFSDKRGAPAADPAVVVSAP